MEKLRKWSRLRLPRFPVILFLSLFLVTFAQGCGYSFQTSKSDLYRRKGVTKLYVAPFVNNSYKPGVENVIYNSVMRVLSAGRRFQLVDDPLKADAVLISSVEDANYSAAGTTNAPNLPPGSVDAFKSLRYPDGYTEAGEPISNKIFESMQVATAYTARISCQFKLQKVGPQVKGWVAPTPTVDELRIAALPPSKRPKSLIAAPGEVLWSETVTRDQGFQAYNQLGPFGTTSPLMNESEFGHAIQELSGLLASDMQDRMFLAF